MSTSNNKIFCDFPCDCKDLAKLISPTPLPSQTPTQTPAPGVSATPTNTPQVSLTPTQTSSPGASPTPTPTNTPAVSSTPPSTQIPGVSATPTPSVTPPLSLDIIIKTLTLNYRPNRLASSAVRQTLQTGCSQSNSKRLIVSNMSSNILTFVNQETDEIDSTFPYIATNSGPVMDVVANYEAVYRYVTHYEVLNSNSNSVGILSQRNSEYSFTSGPILNSSFGDVYRIISVEGLTFVVGTGGLYESRRYMGLDSNTIVGINANSRIVELNTVSTAPNTSVMYGTFYITTTAGVYYISWEFVPGSTITRSLLYPATNNADFRGIDLGDSSNLYVADYANNVVNVYAVNSLIYSISVGRGPTEVKYNPILNHVYVCNYTDNTVSVINAATKAVVKTIPVGAGPDALQISCDGTKLYVANSLTNTITIISQLDKLKQDIFIPVALSPTPTSSPTKSLTPMPTLSPTPTSTPIVANVYLVSMSNGVKSTVPGIYPSVNPVVNFTINDNQTYLTDNVEVEFYSYNTITETRTPKLYNGATSVAFARTIYDPTNAGYPIQSTSFSFDIPVNTFAVTGVYSIRLRVRRGSYIGPWSNYGEFAVSIYVPPTYQV